MHVYAYKHIRIYLMRYNNYQKVMQYFLIYLLQINVNNNKYYLTITKY